MLFEKILLGNEMNNTDLIPVAGIVFFFNRESKNDKLQLILSEALLTGLLQRRLINVEFSTVRLF